MSFKPPNWLPKFMLLLILSRGSLSGGSTRISDSSVLSFCTCFAASLSFKSTWSRKLLSSEVLSSPKPRGPDRAGSSSVSASIPAKYESERSEGGLANEARGSTGGFSFWVSIGVAIRFETALDVPSVLFAESRTRGVCPACSMTYSVGGASWSGERRIVSFVVRDGDNDSDMMNSVATEGA